LDNTNDLSKIILTKVIHVLQVLRATKVDKTRSCY